MSTLQNLVAACQADETLLRRQAQSHTENWQPWLAPVTDARPTGEDPGYDDDFQRIREEVNKLSGIDTGLICTLAEKLLTRFRTVIYRPLAEAAMRTIVQMKLDQVSKRLNRHYGLTTQIDESLYDALTAACLLPDTGARNVDSLLNQQILPVLSQQLLTHMAARQKLQSLRLSWSEEEGIGLEFDRTQGVNA